jgi:DNA invertase Pin-like site-specific DNA recombinase
MSHPQIPPTADTIGYIRVSTEQQAGESNTSLPEQRRAIVARALHLGRVLDPAAVFEDAGISGATADGRPAFMAMLAHCQANPRPAHAPGAVLVLNDSRFGRFDDPEEAGHWRFVMKKLGWIVRFAEGDDMEDGIARGVMRFIGAAQATEYRANLKRTARRAARATAAEGRWQNRAPIGYRRLATRTDGSQRVLEDGQLKAADEVVRLTLGPEGEQEIIRFAFAAYRSGEYSLGRLAELLLARWPQKKWSRGVLNAILKNPAYTGDVVWCRRPHDAAERRATRVRDRAEWVVVPDAHPAIVDRETFGVVQARMASNRVEKRATVGGYPLSGMIRCGTCGAPFVGGGGRRGPDDEPDRYRFYRDRGSVERRANQDALCPGITATLRKRWVERAIVHEIAMVVRDPRVHEIIVEEIDAAIDAAHGSHAERRAAMGQELAQLQSQRKRLIDAVARGTLLEREATTTLAELRARIAAAEAELERSRFAARRTEGMTAIRQHLVTLAQQFETQALRAAGPALRELVRPWLLDAVHDKAERMLTLKIRRVPEVLGMTADMYLHSLPGQDGRKHNKLILVRRLRVPDSPQVAARRKSSGGYK